MRIATSTLLITCLVAGSALGAAPSAVAVPGSVTVCAEAPGESGPVVIDLGFSSMDGNGNAVTQSNSYEVPHNTCLIVPNAPAPSGVYASANRQARRIVVATQSGSTTLKKSRRADFTLGSGENVKVTFSFTAK